MDRFVLIGLGGVIGAILRYAIGAQVQLWSKSGFPYGTLLVNLSGCFVIGLVFFWQSGRAELGSAGLFLITGVLGAYTTFSTLSLDIFTLLRAGQLAQAAAYLVLTNGLGLTLVWLGRVAAQRLLGVS